MTSSILPPRRVLAPCSPITQVSASTTLDLPDPLGPTTQVMPGSKRRVVGDAKDLKPFSVRLLRCTTVPALPARRLALGEARRSASPASDQSATTLSTVPGCRPASQQVQQPLTGRRADPARRPAPGRRAGCRRNPVSPSSSARDRVHHRKPTPCTWPCTQAVSRTSGSAQRRSTSKRHLGARLQRAPDGADLVDGALDDDQQPFDLVLATARTGRSRGSPRAAGSAPARGRRRPDTRIVAW